MDHGETWVQFQTIGIGATSSASTYGGQAICCFLLRLVTIPWRLLNHLSALRIGPTIAASGALSSFLLRNQIATLQRTACSSPFALSYQLQVYTDDVGVFCQCTPSPVECSNIVESSLLSTKQSNNFATTSTVSYYQGHFNSLVL
eukprot:3133448-Amphidinium_carterae.1